MAKKDRTGNRKTREQRKQFKAPELGYYLIVTDTEATERCFFHWTSSDIAGRCEKQACNKGGRDKDSCHD